MTFNVTIKAQITYNADVEADSKEEAIELAAEDLGFDLVGIDAHLEAYNEYEVIEL